MPRARNGNAEYVKLEQRMVLLAWLNGLFGYENNRDLLADMKEAAEGFDASGRSYVYHQLEARGMLVQMPHPTIGTVRLAGTLLNLSATPAEMRLPPPLLGERADAILSRLLALDDRAITELHRDGVA